MMMMERSTHTPETTPVVDPTVVIGVDTGPVPGLGALWFSKGDTIHDAEFSFAQCDPSTCMDVLHAWTSDVMPQGVIIGMEKFVVSTRAARSTDKEAQKETIDLVANIHSFAKAHSLRLVIRPAGIAKPWASDLRLRAAGLWKPTTGSRHARDGARHCLYTACNDGGHHDPLSKKER